MIANTLKLAIVCISTIILSIHLASPSAIAQTLAENQELHLKIVEFESFVSDDAEIYIQLGCFSQYGDKVHARFRKSIEYQVNANAIVPANEVMKLSVEEVDRLLGDDCIGDGHFALRRVETGSDHVLQAFFIKNEIKNVIDDSPSSQFLELPSGSMVRYKVRFELSIKESAASQKVIQHQMY